MSLFYRQFHQFYNPLNSSVDFLVTLCEAVAHMILDLSPQTLVHKYMNERVGLPCWPPKCQQMSHQRWIWGIRCVQAMKHASERIHPCFETQGRCHKKKLVYRINLLLKAWWNSGRIPNTITYHQGENLFSGFTTHTEPLVFVFHGVVASQCERVPDVQPYHGSRYHHPMSRQSSTN